MDIEGILRSIKQDEEASMYLDNTLKKYSEEFYNFLDSVIAMYANEPNKGKELEDFILDLIVQRLRQLSCFGKTDKKYAAKVFQMTLDNIFKR